MGQPDPDHSDPEKSCESLLRLSAPTGLPAQELHGNISETIAGKTEIIDKKNRKNLLFSYKVMIANLPENGMIKNDKIKEITIRSGG